MKTIGIFYSSNISFGSELDAQMFDSVLAKYFTIKLYNIPSIPDSFKLFDKTSGEYIGDTCDIYMFVGEIYDFMFWSEPESYSNKLIIWVPIQITWIELAKLHYVNLVLCKTKLFVDLFSSIARDYKFKYKVQYCGVSSISPYIKLDSEAQYDPNLLVCLPGGSSNKNTSYLVSTWIKSGGFLNIDPSIKLYIGCYDRCVERLVYSMGKKYNMHWVKLKSNKFVYKNLILSGDSSDFSSYPEMIKKANCGIFIGAFDEPDNLLNLAIEYAKPVITLGYPSELKLPADLVVKSRKVQTNDPYTYKLYGLVPDEADFKQKLIYVIKNKDKLSDMVGSFNGHDNFSNIMTSDIIPEIIETS